MAVNDVLMYLLNRKLERIRTNNCSHKRSHGTKKHLVRFRGRLKTCTDIGGRKDFPDRVVPCKHKPYAYDYLPE